MTIIDSRREVLPEFEDKNRFIQYFDENYTYGVLGWVAYLFSFYISYFAKVAQSSYYPKVLVDFILNLLCEVILLAVRVIWIILVGILVPIFIVCYIYFLICNIIESIYENFLEYRIIRYVFHPLLRFIIKCLVFVYKKVTGVRDEQ